MIFDLIIWAFTIYCCIQLGAFLKRAKDELEGEMVEGSDEMITLYANVEYHDGTMYAWEEERKDFLGQGKTMDELAEHMTKRARELYNSDVRIRLTTDDPILKKNFEALNT
jgi:hypothetical protein